MPAAIARLVIALGVRAGAIMGRRYLASILAKTIEVNEMNIPGFSAEAALSAINGHSIVAGIHTNERSSHSVIPQFHQSAAIAPCNCHWVTLFGKDGLPVYSYYVCECRWPDPSSIPNRGLFG